jgi:hypothetical protein
MNTSPYINEQHLDETEVPEKRQYTPNGTITDTARGLRLSIKVSALASQLEFDYEMEE